MLGPASALRLTARVVNLAGAPLRSSGRRPAGGATHASSAGAVVVLGLPLSHQGALPERLRRRVDHGVAIFRRLGAGWLVLSGGPSRGGWVEADAMVARARALGVDAAALVAERLALSTRENVLRTRDLVATLEPAWVVMVSDWWHSRRILAVGRKIGLSATASWPLADPEGWAELREDVRLVLREGLSLVVYRMRGWI